MYADSLVLNKSLIWLSSNFPFWSWIWTELILVEILLYSSKSIELLLSISELETRRELGNEIRDDIEELLQKEYLIKKEDRLLIYKLYKKIKSEFEEIEVKN